jgi:2-succinyl-5-enolpyruvyl-6-hydroxy-3-cyclohexene-1-carboxylate synthase
MPTERFEQLLGTPHSADLGALAAAHGVAHSSVKSTTQLRDAISEPGPRVISVRTDRDENVARHDEIHRAVARRAR